MNQSAIELKDVSFRYKNGENYTLRHLNISLPKGHVLCVTGESGSGKSTLCQLLNGLIPHTIEGDLEGSVEIFRHQTKEFRIQSLSRHVGQVFQAPEMQIVGQTVFEDLAFGPCNYLEDPDEIRRKIPIVLKQVGLSGFELRHTDQLSGGEQQRLAIAGILITRPDILVLDDPFSELDPKGKSRLLHLLFDLKSYHRQTMIITTKHMKFLEPLADQIIKLENQSSSCHSSDTELPEKSPFLSRSHTVNSNRKRLLHIENLTFSYHPDFPVLRDINLSVFQKDIIALTGENGAGKTSLVKIMNGMLTPDYGNILFKNRPLGAYSEQQLLTSIGLVFQNPDYQLFEQTVKDELAFGLKQKGWLPRKIIKAVNEVLSIIQLTHIQHAHPFTLSRGERQILAIAAMIIMEPEILIIDEPTTGLSNREINYVVKLCQHYHTKGMTIIFISHDQAFIQHNTQRIVELNRGKIIYDLPCDVYFSQSSGLFNESL